MNKTFHIVESTTRIAEGTAEGFVLNCWPVLVARSGGRLFATIDRCSHAASALSAGRIRGGNVTCPLHGARFNLASGDCIGGAYKPLMTFDLRENADGRVEVAVPGSPPGAEHLPVPS